MSATDTPLGIALINIMIHSASLRTQTSDPVPVLSGVP